MYFSEIGFRLFFWVMVENKEEVCYTDTIFRQLKDTAYFAHMASNPQSIICGAFPVIQEPQSGKVWESFGIYEKKTQTKRKTVYSASAGCNPVQLSQLFFGTDIFLHGC